MSTDLEIPYDLATIYSICTGNVTDDLLDIYAEICNTFKNIQYSGHVTEIDYIETLLSSQTIATSDAVDSVLEVLITSVEECLAVIGVTINPDIPINLVPSLINYLLEFDATDTPSHLQAIVNDSEDTIECVCDILGFLTPIHSDVWMEHITGVDVKCITAINYQLKLAADRIETLESEASTDALLMRARVNEVKAIMDDVTLLDVSTESSSLEDLYHLHVSNIVDMDPTQAVKEILSLAAISNESSESMDLAIDNVLDDLFYEPSERIKANSKVSYLKRKIEHLLYRN